MSTYGFVKVPRDVEKAVPAANAPTPQRPELPNGPFETAVLAYATEQLPQKTLYHSLRVYLYCLAIMKDQFPNWDLDTGVLFTTCLLHDIGTTDANMKATKMSFEFYGGLIARQWVMEESKDQDYAEAVSEAVIRHQDLGTTGYITSLGLLLQIGTILDNVGKHTHLIHDDTLDYVNRKYSRDGWCQCFAHAIDKENAEKPWGHTSALGPDDFRNDVLANSVRYLHSALDS